MPYDAQNRGASGSNGSSADGAEQAFSRQGNEAAAAGDYEAADDEVARRRGDLGRQAHHLHLPPC